MAPDNPASGSGIANVANVVTAIATALTAFFAYLAYRYTIRLTAPIIESDEPKWLASHKILIPVGVRNRSDTAHRLSTIELLTPKEATISEPELHLAPAHVLHLSLDLYPVGSTMRLPAQLGGAQSIDQTFLKLIVDPPASFSSGKLRFRLTISDKSFRPRHRRFVVRKFIQAQNIKSTADTANKTA